MLAHSCTVVLFHGYGGSKSSMLDKSNIFLQLGFSAVLVDFMGSGGSEGNQTTIGFHEAAQVNTVMEYLKNAGEDSIILFGTSMGAVSVMKAIHDYHIQPAAIILECPFGSMYETVGARFKNMNVPKFPMAPLLVFWGGAQNGFGHNPARYASRINSPTLLMYGEKDKKVSRSEIDIIYNNLCGLKQLSTYPDAGHENYLLKYELEWKNDVVRFLDSVKK